MLGLIIAVILFNSVAFITNKRLLKIKWLHLDIYHIITILMDVYFSVKYHGYWYFNKGVEWTDLPAFTLLGAPTIMLFLNWYPLHTLIF